MSNQDDLGKSFAQQGFLIVENVISDEEASGLADAVEGYNAASSDRAALYGRRNLLRLPEIDRLAASPQLRNVVEPFLGKGAFAVRGLWFDKLPAANWRVAWHQDLTIAVCRRVEAPGFTAWSVKAGVEHVQPPDEVLARMLTVRLHLDDCGVDAGPLRVIAGSHRAERLSAEAIERWTRDGREIICCPRRGGALVMRPLLLHASSPANDPRHRRVIHLEFAADDLPFGLEWQTRVASS
ncbi:MAG TPA: phytanoyl-CoA dioxygenase family protein [Pirellulales bacterium]|nr:phytanoyl-CoA dioxygenase family protein [Pirellulales bacterium]